MRKQSVAASMLAGLALVMLMTGGCNKDDGILPQTQSLGHSMVPGPAKILPQPKSTTLWDGQFSYKLLDASDTPLSTLQGPAVLQR